jgi:hypothetical protein
MPFWSIFETLFFAPAIFFTRKRSINIHFLKKKFSTQGMFTFLHGFSGVQGNSYQYSRMLSRKTFHR